MSEDTGEGVKPRSRRVTVMGRRRSRVPEGEVSASAAEGSKSDAASAEPSQATEPGEAEGDELEGEAAAEDQAADGAHQDDGDSRSTQELEPRPEQHTAPATSARPPGEEEEKTNPRARIEEVARSAFGRPTPLPPTEEEARTNPRIPLDEIASNPPIVVIAQARIISDGPPPEYETREPRVPARPSPRPLPANIKPKPPPSPFLPPMRVTAPGVSGGEPQPPLPAASGANDGPQVEVPTVIGLGSPMNDGPELTAALPKSPPPAPEVSRNQSLAASIQAEGGAAESRTLEEPLLVDLDADEADEAEGEELADEDAISTELSADDAPRTRTPPPPPSEAGRASSSPSVRKPPPPPAPSSGGAAIKPEDDKSKRKRVRQWWERFFSDDYLLTVLPPTEPQISRQVDFIESSLNLQKGAMILDVGCGLGLHAIELCKRGYLVVGLDLSLAMITRAAEAAQRDQLKINFLHADIREITFDGAFDAVICMGTTFGFFDDDANKDVLFRLFQALRPGGRILLDVVNRDYVVRWQPNLVWFEGDGCVCMEESDFNYFNSRLVVKRTVMREDGQQSISEYSLRAYSLHELGQLAQTLGFRVLEVSGQEATRGVFFGSCSTRILLLAERRVPGRASMVMPPERVTGEVSKPPNTGEVPKPPPKPPSAS